LGSFNEAAASEFTKYNLDLVAVQGVRYDEGHCQLPDDYTSISRNNYGNHRLGTGFLVHTGIYQLFRG